MAPKLKTPRVPDRVARASTRVTVAADRGRDWVERQEPGTRKGATIGWFRRYRDADGQLYAVLLTAYIFISVLPVAVVMESSLAADPRALADHLVRRFSLTGAAATTTRSVLDGTSSNQAGAILFAIANVLVFGLGFGRVLQLAHARSWRMEVPKGMVTDQVRFASSLLALLGLVFVFLLETKLLAGQPGWISWALLPLWGIAGVAYFVWMPRMLLHRQVTVRDVLPGAVLTVAALAGMRILSSFLLARWLVSYSRYFGSFGVVIALFFWLMVAATIMIVAAALSPALAERRSVRNAMKELHLDDHPD